MSEPTKARQCAEEILGNINGRRGYRQTWDNIDEEIQQEIKDVVLEIITRHFGDGMDKERMDSPTWPYVLAFANLTSAKLAVSSLQKIVSGIPPSTKPSATGR